MVRAFYGECPVKGKCVWGGVNPGVLMALMGVLIDGFDGCLDKRFLMGVLIRVPGF